jgi:hypothetical protein
MIYVVIWRSWNATKTHPQWSMIRDASPYMCYYTPCRLASLRLKSVILCSVSLYSRNAWLTNQFWTWVKLFVFCSHEDHFWFLAFSFKEKTRALPAYSETCLRASRCVVAHVWACVSNHRSLRVGFRRVSRSSNYHVDHVCSFNKLLFGWISMPNTRTRVLLFTYIYVLCHTISNTLLILSRIDFLISCQSLLD